MKIFTKALLSFSAIAAVVTLIAASGPQTVVNNAAPFALLSDRQLEQVNVSLLARLMGLPLTAAGVQSIVSNAAPFQTLSDRNIAVMQTYLLYQLTGAATNVPISDAAFTNIWLYGDIANGNDGSTVLSVLNGRALYDENGIDAIDFFLFAGVGNPSAGYALNDHVGDPSLQWDLGYKLLIGQWYCNAELRITNSNTRGIALSYLGSGFTNIFVMFTNTASAGNQVTIASGLVSPGFGISSLSAPLTWNSNMVVSPWLWTNVYGTNLLAYIVGGHLVNLTNNGVGFLNGNIIMTNGCTTLYMKPGQWFSFTTNGVGAATKIYFDSL